jgi:uncharacterized protein YggE
MSEELSKALTQLARFTAAAMVMVVLYGTIRIFISFEPQPEPLPAATLHVAGTGEAIGIPDIATMTFSVVEQGDTVTAVTTAGNEVMNNMISVLKGAGIADEDIQTTSYYLSPRYDYSKTSRGDIIGYELNQSVTVKIRDLERTAAVADAVTQAGANSISTPQFEIDDPETVKTEARAEAFDKAKAKAESLAAAAGMELGDIVTFTESGDDSELPYEMRSFGEGDFVSDTVAPTFAAGSQEVTVTVNVTYALK